jgi:hypothetical protein
MIKYFKYILSAIYSFISDAYSQDSRWIYAGTSDNANYYYDSRNIKLDGNTGEIRIKFMYIDSEEWDYCVAKYKVFCDEKKLMAETSLYFDKNGKITEILSCEKLTFDTETPEEAIFNVFMEKMSS